MSEKAISSDGALNFPILWLAQTSWELLERVPDEISAPTGARARHRFAMSLVYTRERSIARSRQKRPQPRPLDRDHAIAAQDGFSAVIETVVPFSQILLSNRWATHAVH
jgi:hypothetical protein